jgi:PBP1b-binding outer membrane lipoprotein LpoB
MFKRLVVVSILALVITACSDDKVDKVEQDHIWKEQIDMIDKAKDVENILQDAAALQQQRIEQQTQ